MWLWLLIWPSRRRRVCWEWGEFSLLLFLGDFLLMWFWTVLESVTECGDAAYGK